MHNKDKTHCLRGHAYTEENTKVLSNGFRRCRSCVKHWNKQADALRKRGPRHNKHGKRQHLRYLYTLSQEQYDALAAEQNHKCKACGVNVDITSNNNLQVDHDHSCCNGPKSCGKCIRGLLCATCNKILGFCKDSTEHLKQLIVYVENYKTQ
jgi:hypothetical protein